MKKRHFIIIGAALTAAVGLAACSQDETQEQAQEKTPIVLNATNFAVTKATRSTIESNWEGVTNVGVSFNNGEKAVWSVTASEGDGYATATIAPSTPLYWDDYIKGTITSVPIIAWCPATLDKPAADDPITIDSDQSDADKLQAQDIIYAYNATASNSNNSMTFNHLTARVTINLKASPYFTTASVNNKAIGVTLTDGWVTTGTYYDGDNGIAIKAADGATTATIKPCEFAATDYYATYEALIVPQAVASQYVTVTLGSTAYKWQVNSPTEFIGGSQYTYDITVSADGLNATFTNSSNITWTNNGESATGSAYITTD